MKCPICEVDLTMSDRQGVEIDYCPKCRGVWLDRGELDKIIERSGAGAPSAYEQKPQFSNQANDRGYGNSDSHHDDHGYSNGGQNYGQRKKKNLLGELFDF